MDIFTKPSIAPIEQIKLLQQRGLIVLDEEQALSVLNAVSFFRLTPYMRPFQAPGQEHKFKDNASFEQIIRLYSFDRRLRLLAIDAIERIEVAVRAYIGNKLCPQYGTHWYLDKNYFKNNYQHERLIQTIQEKQNLAIDDYRKDCSRIDKLSSADLTHKNYLKNQRKKENYARHYSLTYKEPNLMPTWAMLEELSLGELSHLYRGLAKDKDKKNIASGFGLYPLILESWLHTITFIRNICAHHSRLWNRELSITPVNPVKSDFSWPKYLSTKQQHTRLSSVLAMLYHMMKAIHPQTSWGEQLFGLFDNFQEIPVRDMGLPLNWREDSFWK